MEEDRTDISLSAAQRQQIDGGIRSKYRRVAQNPRGLFKYPTGRQGLEKLGYSRKMIDALPQAVQDGYCGVGNPFSLGPIQPGENVLDIGCGAGVDTLIAALLAGPTGNATGVDLVPEMVARAGTNARLAGLQNVTFHPAKGDRLPLRDGDCDVVISNGVINLIPDKSAILKEIRRVLKPAGRLMLADQVLTGPLSDDIPARLSSWFQ